MSYRSGFFANRRGVRLFFTEDRPDTGERPGEAWLICSPILEEKNVAHGAFVSLARALAAKGIRAVRLDYEGHGDSDGDTASLGLDEWVADVDDAAARLAADGVRRLTLLGCRAGALVAARAAADVRAARLVAWCPVLVGDDHLHDLLRLNLTTQLAVYKKVQQTRDALIAALEAGEVVNIVGWTIGRPLLASLTGVTFADLIPKLDCPVEVLDLSRRAGHPAPAPVAALAAPPRVAVRAVPGLPFWIDGNFIDYQQAELVQATVAIVGGQSV